MNLQERIDLLIKLGQYLQSDNTEWLEIKQEAERQNGWFTHDFIDTAIENIANDFLEESRLKAFAEKYQLDATHLQESKNIGLVMAGNIPLVGFHDWLCIFLSGHNAMVKPSSKDRVLIEHIVEKLSSWNNAVKEQTRFAGMLKGADAYIATGSNNSARYFEYYFSKYPHIIRRNRTSVAILTGNETLQELGALADDVNLYFGLGCRNVTKLYLPKEYDFVPLLESFRKYSAFADHNKYKNNYDYQLAILLLNNKYYMTNGVTIMVENEGFFSPITQLHYQFYSGEKETLLQSLGANADIQCIVGNGLVEFGQSQRPQLADFADGLDTMAFLTRGLNVPA